MTVNIKILSHFWEIKYFIKSFVVSHLYCVLLFQSLYYPVLLFRLPELSKDQIRVLIFKESERRGDKALLFDSDAIVVNKEDEVRYLKYNL